MLKENTKDENEGIIQTKEENEEKTKNVVEKVASIMYREIKNCLGIKKDRRDFIILNVSCS